MPEIKKILVPVDLHQNTNVLVEFAVDMGKKFNAELNFLHVVPPLESYSGVYLSSWGETEEKMVASAEEKMNAIVESNKENCVSCNGKVIIGDIVDNIIAHSKAEKASMIIMGTHGRKGLEKILLGSVANAVAGKAPCPLLLFNPYN